MLFAPFQRMIWVVLFAYILVVSAAYVLIDSHDVHKFSELKDKIVYALWCTWSRFCCGGDNRDPKSMMGQVVQAIYGLVRLVVVALYGASLTSILIEEANTSNTMQTLGDLKDSGGRAVLFQGDPLKDRMMARNPWLVLTEVPRSEILNTTNLREFLEEHDSNAIIVSSPDAYTIARQAELCDVSVTGVVLAAGGGFIVNYDNCHSDISFMFDSILMSMESDGSLDFITNSYANNKCTSSNSPLSAVDKYQISIRRVAGIFILGAVAFGASLVLGQVISLFVYPHEKSTTAETI